jgi:uncharacterized protein YoxC
MYLEIFLIIAAIAIVLLLIFCIPVLIQIWRTTRDVAVTLETINRDLPMILKNLEEITANISSSTASFNREVQNFSSTISRFQLVIKGIVDDIQRITPLAMNLPVVQTVKNAVAVIKGIRVFLEVLSAKEEIPTTKI